MPIMPPSVLKSKGFQRQGYKSLWVLSCDIGVIDTAIWKVCHTFLGRVKHSKKSVQRYYTPLKHWHLIWHNITVFINTALRIWNLTIWLRVTLHSSTPKMTELGSFEMLGTVTPTPWCHTAENELWGQLLFIWWHQSGRLVARSGGICKNVSVDRLLLNALSFNADSGGICRTG